MPVNSGIGGSADTSILPTYVLITTDRDEAEFIELTLQSMVTQTFRPLKWVIVSDGSTDGTDDIVSRKEEALSRVSAEGNDHDQVA